jgi:phosphotransferase system HPr (HPr) family protein
VIEKTFTVKARLGLHARAAARLVRVASSFESKLSLKRVDGDVVADAKSILSVLMLAASQGTVLCATAEGDDEEAAIQALDHLFSNGFGELPSDNG